MGGEQSLSPGDGGSSLCHLVMGGAVSVTWWTSILQSRDSSQSLLFPNTSSIYGHWNPILNHSRGREYIILGYTPYRRTRGKSTS